MEYLRRKKRLGDMLLQERVITEEQLNEGLEAKKGTDKKLGEILVDLGFTNEEAITRALTRQLGIEYVEPSTMKISDEILNLIPPDNLRKHSVLPFEYAADNANIIRVAMVDPMDLDAIDDIEMLTGLRVEACICTTREMEMSLDKYFGDAAARSAAEQYAKERGAAADEATDALEDDDVNNSPIVMLVKTIIEQAARQRASDIHIEALRSKVRIRYRIDGALYEKMSYDIQLLSGIVARLKIIGGMDISEKRKPQDGRISMMVDRREYDIRVSILPTVYGEKVVMRLALKNALTRNKLELGFSPEEMAKFDHILSNPHGIILVTGPTGSGKSTTLYTALSELNTEDVNIITVEDPVEANIDGINQVNVNNKAGLTFAAALRSILRQDPDIIMIGEIRDEETASIAVQASITGHLVVSTLHTNSSASTITRLEDMGINSYLVGDSVVGIIAQRLVRRLCPHCRKARASTPKENSILGIREDIPIKIYDPVGCSQCNDTGYWGRIGVYEILEVSPKLKRLITDNGNADQIKDLAVQEGMQTLRMSATKFVLDGTTTVTEMMRVSFES